jgi:hypothetical protein
MDHHWPGLVTVKKLKFRTLQDNFALFSFIIGAIRKVLDLLDLSHSPDEFGAMPTMF